MKITEIEITKLKPYNKNAKDHPQTQIDNVAQSIKEFGFQQPIVVDKDYIIIIGHCRWLASLQLGLAKVPVVVANELNEEQVKKLRLLDNKTNESEWNIELLLDDLQDLDFSDYQINWNLPEPEIEEKEIVEDDTSNLELFDEPKSKMGDLYELGEHRLLCGDSTKLSDIQRLLKSRERERCELTLTDAPYGVDIVKGGKVGGDKAITFNGKKTGKIGGDVKAKCNTYLAVKGDETTDTARLNYEIIKDLSDNQILFGGNYFTDFLPPSPCWIIWDKKNGDNNFADVELAWTSFDTHAKLYEWLWNGMSRQGDRKSELKGRIHPTQKPVGLLAKILKDYSKEGDSILDCFGGSGSTLIACEQTNRTCLMIEFEAHYIDLIIQRYINFTGNDVYRLNDDGTKTNWKDL